MDGCMHAWKETERRDEWTEMKRKWTGEREERARVRQRNRLPFLRALCLLVLRTRRLSRLATSMSDESRAAQLRDSFSDTKAGHGHPAPIRGLLLGQGVGI